MADKYRCPVCLKDVVPTAARRFRKHNKDSGTECDMTGAFIPAHVLASGPADSSDVPVLGRDYAECPACGRTPRLTPEGTYAPHRIIANGSEQCPMSGEAFRSAGGGEGEKCEDKPLSQESTTTREESNRPCDAPPLGEISPTAAPTLGDTMSDVPPIPADVRAESTSPPTAAPRRISTVPLPPMESATEDAKATQSEHASTGRMTIDFRQPAPPFEQPGRLARVLAQAQPMTDLGREIAARVKETFYAYSSRLDRNQQTTMGPSEIGTPCERRIAMSLLRVPPTNPGGDGWASFVGTCVHEGLARMFVWAGTNTGRYAVEVPLTFPSKQVPRGTGDLLDRTLCMFLDHKCMGRWSLDKLTTKGPSPVYRVQVHTYAYGARLKGEKVDHVAIIGWPRESSSLDDLYVWTEPYDPSVAMNALKRVERIARRIDGELGEWDRMAAARTFPVADDCRFCPFHAPGDSEGERGCNGRQ